MRPSKRSRAVIRSNRSMNEGIQGHWLIISGQSRAARPTLIHHAGGAPAGAVAFFPAQLGTVAFFVARRT